MEEKTYVADIDRTVYDIKDDEKDAYKLQAGLTPEIVQKISDEKNDPAWMQLFRLQSLQVYNESRVPQWGPPIDGLDMDNIVRRSFLRGIPCPLFPSRSPQPTA